MPLRRRGSRPNAERARRADAARDTALATAAKLYEAQTECAELKKEKEELKKVKTQLQRFKNARGETAESAGGGLFAKQMQKRMLDEAKEEAERGWLVMWKVLRCQCF